MGASLADWKKKFWTERESGSSVSDYWLRDSLFERSHSRLDYSDDNWDYENNRPLNISSRFDHFALAKYQRAIANFVHILTQRKNVNVRFNTLGKNYATSKNTIVLSPDLDAGKFDVAVGLALHEASHILYTNFKTYETWLTETCNVVYDRWGDLNEKYGIQIRYLVKSVFNIIEDRYIDARTYKEAPGYRGYYSALYIEYFGSELINRGFYSPDYSEPTVNNYLFHIVNMTNPSRNVQALPGLDKIITLIDLPNILRLGKTKDRCEIAQLVIDIIINEIIRYVDSLPKTQGSGDRQSQSGPNQPNSTNDGELQKALQDILNRMDDQTMESMMGGSSDGESDDHSDMDDSTNNNESGSGNEEEGDEEDGAGGNGADNDEKEEGDEESNGDGNEEDKSEQKPLKESESKKLNDIIDKQLKLTNDETSKGTALSENDSKMISDIADAGVDIVTVKSSSINIGTNKVYVVNNVTPRMVGTNLGLRIGIARNSEYEDVVERGINKGRLLAKKLKLRAEENVLTSTRLKAGRIDKRLLAEVGFDNYDIFYRTTTESYNNSYIHLSIDASGSMDYGKWTNALEVATIIATASTLIPNVRVVVTARSTMGGGGLNTKSYIATMFDSKIHGVAHIRSIFPHLRTTCGTPEGLCFAAVLDNIIKNSINTDAYFINICDGEPTYSNGVEHTREQRLLLEKHGIRILSYYVESSYYYSSGGVTPSRNFIKMYGEKNSFGIASADIGIIAKTMNQKLLEK